MVVGTKIRIVAEGVPAARRSALRFATKLPNASNESGLGLDTTDFYASLLVAKTVQSVRIVGNIGLGILGDPTRGDRQNDVLTYGVSFARALTQRPRSSARSTAAIRHAERRPAARHRIAQHRALRRALHDRQLARRRGLLFGVTSHDPTFGFAAGFTYVFNAFQVP